MAGCLRRRYRMPCGRARAPAPPAWPGPGGRSWTRTPRRCNPHTCSGAQRRCSARGSAARKGASQASNRAVHAPAPTSPSRRLPDQANHMATPNMAEQCWSAHRNGERMVAPCPPSTPAASLIIRMRPSSSRGSGMTLWHDARAREARATTPPRPAALTVILDRHRRRVPMRAVTAETATARGRRRQPPTGANSASRSASVSPNVAPGPAPRMVSDRACLRAFSASIFSSMVPWVIRR